MESNKLDKVSKHSMKCRMSSLKLSASRVSEEFCFFLRSSSVAQVTDTGCYIKSFASGSFFRKCTSTACLDINKLCTIRLWKSFLRRVFKLAKSNSEVYVSQQKLTQGLMNKNHDVLYLAELKKIFAERQTFIELFKKIFSRKPIVSLVSVLVFSFP